MNWTGQADLRLLIKNLHALINATVVMRYATQSVEN